MMREPRLRQRQKGIATMMGVLFMGAAIAVILFQIILPIMRDFERRQAALRAGNYLAQYNAAIRQFYGFHGVTAVPTGNRTGTDWLKNATTCFGGAYAGGYSPPEPGNPSQGFLPCEFPNVLPFGVTPSTTLAVAADVFTATTTLGPFTGDEFQVEYLTGVMVMQAAQAERWVDGANVTEAFFDYAIEDNPASANFGRITATATNQYNLNEIYLPRDGNLPMQGDLNMDGNSVNNVGDIVGTGSIAFQVDLIAGRDVLAGNEVVARGDVVSTQGDLMTSTGNVIASTGNVIVPQGRIIANDNIESSSGDLISRDAYIRDVNIDGRAARLSQAVYDKRVVPSTSIVTTPICPNGTRALIFASPEAWVSGATAENIYGMSRQLLPMGGGTYQVNLLILLKTATGQQWYALPPQYGLVNVTTKCP